MTQFDAIILGVIEGVTEFLPISSTGHLILASSLLAIPQTDFVKTFEIAIQMGAILAVVVMFWKSFLNRDLVARLVVAFIPTGIIGLAVYGIVKTYLIGNLWVVIGALFIGGIVLILFEKYYQIREHGKQLNEITFRDAILIGIAQAVAVIPGVSRSGATIVGGLMRGISRVAIVEFSFLLAVPTMIIATGFDLFNHGFSFQENEVESLLIGFITAFIVAIATIRWLLTYIRKHSFTSFGIYRIVLSVAFFFFLIT